MRTGCWDVVQAQLRERPSLVLVGVLLLLVLLIGVARPGTIGGTWAANTILFAAPLGIVAAGQTLVMLTAGIDLSVAAVMTAAAYVAASQSYFGSIRAVLLALAVGLVVGFLSGVAGLVLVGAINAADLSLGDVYLLPSVAAVVIGGTSIYGGNGGYTGSLVGALILTVLSSLFTLLDAPDPLKQILYGAIVVLLAAVYVRTAGDTR